MDSEMNTPDSNSHAHERQAIPYLRVGFGWGAVVAGLATAMALNLFFAEIGIWLNLSIIDGQSDAGTIAVVNAIAWVLGGLVALFAGAWIAGRMANARTATEGSLHGIAVWAAGAVVMLLLTFNAAGVVGGGMIDLVGKGLGAAGEVAQTADPSWDGIREELEFALGDADSGTDVATAGGQESGATDETRFRDRSRILELAASHFSLDSGPANAADREELVDLIAARTGLSRSAADETLAQWDRVWERTVEGYEAAEAEVLQAAEAARETAQAAAGWAALAMLLSALVALAAGAHGASCRPRLGTQHVVGHPDGTITPTSPLRKRSSSKQAHPVS